jgi:hypothetical protein
MAAAGANRRGSSRGVIVKEAGGFCKPLADFAVELPDRDIIPGK